MDLFLLISVLHVNFYWLGVLVKMMCWKENVAGKATFIHILDNNLLSRIPAMWNLSVPPSPH